MRIGIVLFASAMPFGLTQAQTQDGKVTYLTSDQVQAAFAKGSPLIEVEDYKIHASRRESQPGLAEIHARDTDIIYVLQGSATLVTGGQAVAARPTVPPHTPTRPSPPPGWSKTP